VSIDNFAAGYEITEHLIGLGHEKIGFLKGSEISVASALRHDGFVAAMRDQGLPILDNHVITGEQLNPNTGYECARKLLTQKEQPTAVFSCNDEMTAGLLAAIYELKVDVPTQLSVAVFDDANIAQSVWPTLTTIRAPLQSIGKEAVDLLANNILQKRDNPDSLKTQAITVPYELNIRGSTTALR